MTRVALATRLVHGLGALASPLVVAGAELPRTAHRVAEVWRRAGAQVAVGPEQFLSEDETRVLLLPEVAAGRCTTVWLLGPRGLGFSVRVDWHGEDDSGPQFPSQAGSFSLERCDEEPLRRLLVTVDSGRGALEVLVAASDSPLPSLAALLPERAEARLGPMPEPGALTPLTPPERRADAEETRARRDGSVVLGRVTWVADADGAGSGGVAIDSGCHTFGVFAPDPRERAPHRGKLDVDAEARAISDDRLLARDRTDAPDAHLSFCVGEPTVAGVVFVGAPPRASVLITHVGRPLPEHLPDVWGGEARGRMASALWAHHVPSLPDGAVILAQGGSGSTPVPLHLEPGACYVAVVALVQGTARSIGLRVHQGARESGDDRGRPEGGAAVAFCQSAGEPGVAVVEARGTPLLTWGLAVFDLQAGAWL